MIGAVAATLSILMVPAAKERLWLMFFLKQENAPTLSREESDEAFKGHIGNMQNQAKEKRLFAAGPLDDPSKVRRGITVCSAADLPGVKALFKSDPFVKAGVFTVTAMPWKVERSAFHPEVDPETLGPFRLVLFTRGQNYARRDPSLATAQTQAMRALVPQYKGVFGVMEDSDTHVAAMILKGEDTDGLKTSLEASPYIRQKAWKYEILPLFMSRDIVG